MEIKPINRVSISDQVCDQIKQLILSGTWKLGQKIPSETDLAESFGVSRVSIREAILKLTAIGLLESRFSGGTYVREVGADIYLNMIVPVAYLGTNSIMEVLEFRQVVEAKQAGLAAKKATLEDVKRLEEMVEEMERQVGNVEAFSKADLRFHMELSQITQNSLLVACMKLISDVLGENMLKLVERRGFESGIRCHREIIEAVKENDERRATLLMDEHIEDVCQTFVRLFTSVGEKDKGME
ncbi:MAG: FadR family transcriptional regulator [Lachnospiraceae bacterium]|jgi:GntR family transcriptional repressor for pyruvate dehydrogenase complex|nr:FadR family transcriptional regulator [Lachnospiraceae bacterium]MCI8995174.1 FadR family transcriptional regulator [Lachnospiraceae bacterium]MCI9132754.1 FadR family transcriptional regulator [Lachnospiraceae bacterium]